MNRDWRGKDKSTDVLSFPQYSPEELRVLPIGDGPWALGDVIISLETAERQSREKGVSYRGELEWLLVHGILHLLGYDHELSAADDRRMRAMEKRILRGIRGR